MFESSQAMQTQFQDSLSLLRRKPVRLTLQTEFRCQLKRAAGIRRRIAQQLQHTRGIPRLCHQLFFRLGCIGRSLDQFDDSIDIGQCNGETLENVTPLSRLSQQEHGTPRHYLAAVVDEGNQHLLQVQQTGLTIHQRHHVDTEYDLHLRLRIQVVHDNLRYLALAQLDHDAHTVLVAFIAQLGNTFQQFFLDQIGDALNQSGFVHLIRNFVDDDGFLAGLAVGLDSRLGTNVNLAATGTIRLHDAGTAVDKAGSRKIRALHMLHQAIYGDVRVVHQRHTCTDDFAHVVWRNVGSHAHRDT